MKLIKIPLRKIGAVNLIIVMLLAVAWVLIGINGTLDAINVMSNNPIYKGKADKKEVSLTINVVWGEEYIGPILEILKKEKVRATFFIGGSWAENNAELLEMIIADGHEIGSHGYGHEHMSELDYQGNLNEIKKAAEAIFSASGRAPVLFAPPYGEFSDATLKAAAELGCTTVMWSVDTIDWRGDGTEAIIKRIKKNVHDGAIILAHPTENTVSALPEIIKIVRESGREFVTVSELTR